LRILELLSSQLKRSWKIVGFETPTIEKGWTKVVFAAPRDKTKDIKWLYCSDLGMGAAAQQKLQYRQDFSNSRVPVLLRWILGFSGASFFARGAFL
jgi:hypothetical protein